MNEHEQREILEKIARDESNYPRDRIAAVRALREVDATPATRSKRSLRA